MFIYLLYFGSIILSCDAEDYTNYTLFRAIARNRKQLNFIAKLWENYDVNYWNEPKALDIPIEFVVHPAHKYAVSTQAYDLNMICDEIMTNVQMAFEMQTVQRYMKSKLNTMNWNSYFRLNDIYNWLQDLAKVHASFVAVQSIGKSIEDRDIMALRVMNNSTGLRSVVIIEGGIHGREWISPAVVTFLINEIVHAPWSADANLHTVANAYDWYFIPVLNPDGYEYSHSADRLWRKNRNGSGVDLNRNFDSNWKSYADKLPRSPTFSGSHAFSEPETQALAKLVKAKGERLEYYISFHSYGEYMIIPYAYSRKHLGNYDEMKRMCTSAIEKMVIQHNSAFLVGNSLETLGYLASGFSTDWVKQDQKVPYALQLDLRDRGIFGYALPNDDIIPACQETLTAITSILTPRRKTVRKLRDQDVTSRARKITANDTIVILLYIFVFVYYSKF